jgi:hypothetical protein
LEGNHGLARASRHRKEDALLAPQDGLNGSNSTMPLPLVA